MNSGVESSATFPTTERDSERDFLRNRARFRARLFPEPSAFLSATLLKTERGSPPESVCDPSAVAANSERDIQPVFRKSRARYPTRFLKKSSANPNPFTEKVERVVSPIPSATLPETERGSERDLP